MSQMERKTKGDFVEQVEGDLKLLNVDKQEILAMSSNKLKECLKKSSYSAAYQHLIGLAHTHSKVRENIYNNLDGMDHLRNAHFSPDLANILFKFRTRMFNVKNNFRNNYKSTNTLCPLCNLHEDTQQHLFECIEIWKQPNKPTTTYEDIFSSDNDILLKVAKELKMMVTLREDLELQIEPV